ncbi:MAG TPA: F0F1 ATP synthase subunit delta [Acidothermaceae bacterium]|nr:F0F1 ATP synthase subunit delta [Acidothermaceae bacterium]
MTTTLGGATTMQGASRDALAQSWAQLEELLANASVDDAAKVSDELFAVVALLDEQVGLRRAVTDPSIEAARKAGLIEAVLASRVDASTLQVVRELVSSRWSRMRDLGDAAEQLAVLARLIGADRAQAGQSDEVEDELFRFTRIVESRPALRDALADRNLPADNKVSLVNALLADKTTQATLALVVQLVSHPRGRTPEQGLAEYGEIASRRRQRSVARVTTAVALTDDERSRLRAALAKLYGHDVHLQVELDPHIVGGLVVQVGDEVIDGSVAGRLAQARQRLR